MFFKSIKVQMITQLMHKFIHQIKSSKKYKFKNLDSVL